MSDEIAAPVLRTPTLEAIFWRGAFLHQYAGVEWTVTDLLARAYNHPAYEALGDVPFTWPKRLKRLTEVLDIPGPIAFAAKPIRAVLTEFTLAEQYRHIFVHGFMGCGMTEGEPREVYIRSHHWEGGILHERSLTTSVDLLREVTEQLRPLVEQLITLVDRVCEVAGLEPRPASSRSPVVIKSREF